MDTSTKSGAGISAEEVLRERIRQDQVESAMLQQELRARAVVLEQETLEELSSLIKVLNEEAKKAIQRLESLGFPGGELLRVATNPTVVSNRRLLRRPKITYRFIEKEFACWRIHPVKGWYVTSDIRIVREQALSDENGNLISTTLVFQEFVLTLDWLHTAKETLGHLRALGL